MPSSLYYPILAIPAYQAFSLFIHFYATTTLRLSGYNINRANPRASFTPEALQGKVPEAIIQKFQRAKAAEANTMEQIPIFSAAVLASIVANRTTVQGAAAGSDVTGLTRFIGLWAVIRTAYVLAYVNISGQKTAGIRSILWVFGVLLLCSQFYKVAQVLG